MLILKGHFLGASITIDCKDLDHAVLLINTLHLDDPFRFDPVHDTFLLLHSLSNEGRIKKLDPAFYRGQILWNRQSLRDPIICVCGVEFTNEDPDKIYCPECSKTYMDCGCRRDIGCLCYTR